MQAATIWLTLYKKFSGAMNLSYRLLLVAMAIVSWAQAQPAEYLPTGKEGEVEEHLEFTLCYAEEHEQPWWVAYCLTAAELDLPPRERLSFIMDRGIETRSASSSDYTNTGYDRGHLSRAEYNKSTEEGYRECFMMSNISPQFGQNFNRTGGDWYALEELEMAIAHGLDSIYAVSGPVFLNNLDTIGDEDTRITVPGYFYKAMLAPDGSQAIGFILQHDTVDVASLWDAAVTLDSLEVFTGLNFFPVVPEEIEAELNLIFWQQFAELGEEEE